MLLFFKKNETKIKKLQQYHVCWTCVLCYLTILFTFQSNLSIYAFVWCFCIWQMVDQWFEQRDSMCLAFSSFAQFWFCFSYFNLFSFAYYKCSQIGKSRTFQSRLAQVIIIRTSEETVVKFSEHFILLHRVDPSFLQESIITLLFGHMYYYYYSWAFWKKERKCPMQNVLLLYTEIYHDCNSPFSQKQLKRNFYYYR